MLGYKRAIASPRGPDFGFGPGTGEILLDEVLCKGTETNIGHCNHDPIGNSYRNPIKGPLDHSTDAGVVCSSGIFISYMFLSIKYKTMINIAIN